MIIKQRKPIICSNYASLLENDFVLMNHDLKYDFCKQLDGHDIVAEIINSYTKPDSDLENSLKRQISIDYARMCVYINGVECNALHDFYEYSTQFKKYNHAICDNLHQLFELLMTQATFYNQFKIIHDIFSCDNVVVTHGIDSPCVHITNHDNKLLLEYTKTFDCVDLDNTFIKRLNTVMVIEIDLFESDIGNLYNQFFYCCINNCTVYWTKLFKN